MENSETATQVQPASSLTPEARKLKLQERVNEYVLQGYRVVSQTDFTAQLIRPRRFSVGWALFWALLFGFGVLIYVLFFMLAVKDDEIYLTVDELGTVDDPRTRRANAIRAELQAQHQAKEAERKRRLEAGMEPDAATVFDKVWPIIVGAVIVLGILFVLFSR